MKKIIRLLSALACSISFSCTVTAAPFKFSNSRPAVCPEAITIKQAGLLAATEFSPTVDYFAYQISNYSTDNVWGFFLGPIKANNSAEAFSKANNLLPSTVLGKPSPEWDSQTKVWICLYHFTAEYIALAITPLQETNSKKLASIFLTEKQYFTSF